MMLPVSRLPGIARTCSNEIDELVVAVSYIIGYGEYQLMYRADLAVDREIPRCVFCDLHVL